MSGLLPWPIRGRALDTARRRGGAVAAAGTEYQRGFALLKLAEMLSDRSDLIGLRYEGAQDVDLMKADGSVEFVQLKDEVDETYGPVKLGAIFTGFALDLRDADEPERLSFRLVVRTSPGSAALRRLRSRNESENDLDEYARSIAMEASLAALDETSRRSLVREVIERTAVDIGYGVHDGSPVFDALAERVLRRAGFGARAGEVADLLYRALTARAEFDRGALLEMTSHMGREEGSELRMAPLPPATFTGYVRIIAKSVERLVQGDRASLVGLGGAGKTSIAMAVAARPEIAEKYPDGVLWTSVGRNGDAGAAILVLLLALGRQPGASADTAALAALLRAALSGRRMLVIADDVWHASAVSSLIPPGGCGLVVTSRSSKCLVLHDPDPIEVSGLEGDEPIQLLTKALGRRLVANETRHAADFCARVGNLPLAITLGAALVRRGEALLRLIDKLDDERLRLGALDLDRGDAVTATPDDRREISVEACLGLSASALDATLRTALYRMAVLPRGSEIDPELAGYVFGVDQSDAQDLLRELSDRGLLTRLQPSWDGRFILHDLVLDYAISAFGPRRAAVARAPEGLPISMRALRAEFLARMHASSPTGRWTDAAPLSHLDQHLAWHLIQAGRADLIGDLLQEEERGQAAWYARQQRGQNTTGFLQDLALAARESALPVTADADAATIMAALRIAIVTSVAKASIADRASRVPAALLSRLVHIRLLDLDEAIAHARAAHGLVKAWAMTDLLALIPPAGRAQYLQELFGVLADPPWLPALADDYVLDSLTSELVADELDGLLAQAAALSPLDHAKVIVTTSRRVPDFALSGLKSFHDRPEARLLDKGWVQGELLLSAAGLDGSRTFAELLDLVSEADVMDRVRTELTALAPANLHADILTAATAGTIDRVASALDRYGGSLSDAGWSAGVASARAMCDPADRAWALARLAGLSRSKGAQGLLQREALTSLQSLADGDWRKVDGLGRLLPVLSGSDRSAAERAFLAAGRQYGLARIGRSRLREIICNLSRDGLLAALDVLGVAGSSDRTMVLPVLLEFAPEDLVGAVADGLLEQVTRTGEVGDLTGCVHRIPDELLPWILQAMDFVLPAPELVTAAVALTGNPPQGSLAGRIERSWPAYRPDDRIRLASAHADMTKFYRAADAALLDVMRIAGFVRDETVFTVDRPIREAWRVLANLEPAEVRAAILGSSRNWGSLSSHSCDEAIEVLGDHLAAEEVEKLIGQSLSDRLAIGGIGLSILAGLSPEHEEALLDLAVERVRDLGPATAAHWVARFGRRAGAARLARLEAIRAPQSDAIDALHLEVALAPWLRDDEREAVERDLGARPLLGSGFVRSLHGSLYSAKMRAHFEACVRRADERLFDSGASEIGTDPAPLLHADPVTVEHAFSKSTLSAGEVAVIVSAMLESASGQGLRTMFSVLARLAPVIRSRLGEQATSMLVETLIRSADLYAGRPLPSAEPPTTDS